VLRGSVMDTSDDRPLLESQPDIRPLLGAIVATYAVGLLAAIVAGHPMVVVKSALVPIVAIAALRSARPIGLVRDWLPFASVILLFDAFRGGIYSLVTAGYRPVFVDYVVALESRLTGTPAISIPLQHAVHSPWLDIPFAIIHAGHFVFFFVFGMVLWNRRPELFALFSRSLLWVFALGLVGYVLWPTAPPWMAAEQGAIPAVAHLTQPIYAKVIPGLYGAFDVNPVAAMPSLHVAFPVLCALVAGRAFKRGTSMLLWLYAAVITFGVMYLGEHYFVDVLAGAILAIVVFGAVRPIPPRAAAAPLSRVVAISLGFVVTAAVIEAWR
jgi:membrane-associated phospholipid phosphatase